MKQCVVYVVSKRSLKTNKVTDVGVACSEEKAIKYCESKNSSQTQHYGISRKLRVLNCSACKKK